MKLVKTLALCLAVSGTPVALADYDMMNDLPGPDQPPSGRSLFDFLTTDSSGAQNVVFPIESLIGQLRQRSGSEPRVTMIPKGRSLQRDNADFSAPRFVFGFDGGVLQGQSLTHAHLAVTNQLFLGYAEKANQIEVISFNKAAGRFEFQLVHDYKDGGARNVTYASRALCTKCHHSGSPTFGPPPWTETNAIGVTSNETKIADLITQAMNGATTFHGFSIQVQKDIPYGISDAATDANGLMPYQKMWTDGCGKDDAQAMRCRGYAFQFALEMQAGMPAAGTNPQGMTDFTQLQTNYWQQNFTGGLSVPTHALAAYNPLVDVANSTESCDPNSDIGSTPVPGSGPNDGFPDLQPGLTAAQMAQVTQLLANATIPRAKDPLCHVEPPLKTKTIDHCGLCVVFGVRAFLYDSDRDWIKQATGDDATKLVTAVNSLVQKSSPALANRAFRRNVALAALATELGVALPSDPAYDADNPALPPLALDIGVPVTSGGDGLTLMKAYCYQSCHATMPGLNFLKGTDDQIVTTLKTKKAHSGALLKDEIVVRLSYDQPEDPNREFMPLANDTRRTALEAKPADRQAIIEWAKNL